MVGPGNALCDKSEPTSSCPVDGGVSLGLGGAWRFHRRFAAGLELSTWSYKVRDSWKGQLTDAPTDVELSSSYIALFGRFYFVAGESVDAYLGFGVGAGSVNGKARNAGGSYDIALKGATYPLSVGAEWKLAPWLRLGPQALIYVHKSNEVCETLNGAETCKGATNDQNAVPWRLGIVGTFLLGGP